MDTIQIANILLTRRCNLSCDYCHLVKNYEGKPSIYPDMKHYCNHELTANGWIEIIDRLYKNNPNVFLIFYGGEPFLYHDLDLVLEYCNKSHINYTVISNNTDAVQREIYRIYEQNGQYNGFTSSVDPSILQPDDGTDEWKKSMLAFERLSKFKKDGIANDVVAEITCNSKTINDLYRLVKFLSEKGIYSSITCVDDKKNPYYDFSSVLPDSSLMVQSTYEVKQEFQKIMTDPSLLVHIPEMLIKLHEVLPSKMKCKIYRSVHNVTIDSDGTFRLCLRIRGYTTPQLPLDQVIDKNGLIHVEFKHEMMCDYNEYCRGCNWTCMLMSKYFSENILQH